jgi:hypothetical protein
MSNNVIQNTIGTDPEFFLTKGDELVSSQSAKIQGTKHEPVALKNGGTIQRDNVAVEFATVPADDGKDFVEKVRSCLVDTYDMLPEGHDLIVEPSATFDQVHLTDPEAQEFGCDPDFNAYTVSMNEKPWCGDSGFRSCGAHIHVGCLGSDGKALKGLGFLLTFSGKILAIKSMDLFHGTISTVLDNSNAAVKRRELYGKAGAHRPTDYGVEYRVLSNYWMKSPELVMLMDGLTRDAMGLIVHDKLEKVLDIIGEDELQSVINDGLVVDAQKIIETYVIPNMSPDTLDYYDMCVTNLPKYKSVKEEWGI